MAEIGKITPGKPVITRQPRERPPAEEKEPRQQESEPQNNENNELHEDENKKHKDDKNGGIDFYV